MNQMLGNQRRGVVAGRWFSDKGCLMFIEHSDGSDDAEVKPLHDAVLLDEHDDLLRCVDAWLTQPHDWRPVDTVSSMPVPHVSLRTLTKPSRRVSLVLPPCAGTGDQGQAVLTVDRRRALPGEWQPFVAIRYQEQFFSLLLDTVTLGTGDGERLTAGALVVLPASFEPQWSVRLKTLDPGSGLCLNATLDTDTRSLAIAPSQEAMASWQESPAIAMAKVNPAPAADTSITRSQVTHESNPGNISDEPSDEPSVDRLARQDLVVVLQSSLPINTQLCENAWQSGDSLELDALEEVSRLHVRLCLQHTGEPHSEASDPVWFGTLLRLGRGFGVIVDSDLPIDGRC